jgi:hypothetical protein
MIRERKVEATAGPEGHPAGYRVTANDENGKRSVAFFAHTRADEYRHAEFIYSHRSSRNGKPYRSKAQKELAREKAKRVDGTWVTATGRSFHDSTPAKPAVAAA